MGFVEDRQKNAIVTAINKAVKQNKSKPVTVKFNNSELTNISNAKTYLNKNMGSYSDIIISPKNSKDLYISLKSENVSSSSSNNFREIDAIVPGLSARFMKAAYNQIVQMELNPGDPVPEIFGRISDNIKEDIVIGTKAVGGPIDYIFEGSSIRTDYDEENNLLTINGNIISPKQYAKRKNMFLALKPKRDDQRFDPDAKYGGIPKIYGESTRGDDDVIIEITEEVSRNATIVKV